MRVTYHVNDTKHASSRLRCVIPAQQLKRLGCEIVPDGDVLVWGKHFLDLEAAKKFPKKVFDVCDDHFDGPLGGYYRKAIQMADLVTCNSQMMRFRLHQMGVIATVIPDPYETERLEPAWGEGVLWFGHESNLNDLYRVAGKIQQRLTVVSKKVSADIVEWSQETQKAELAKCAVVILPTGKSPCKSANRMLEAVMAGKFVVAEPLPAYEEFARYLWVGDIEKGVDWAFNHRFEALEKVKQCQIQFAHTYGPEQIGKQWFDALQAL